MFAAEFDISSSVNHSNTQTPTTMKTLNNTVRLIGNLGFDPEVHEIAKDRKVARMSVATNESYLNAAGERITNTQWHTVIAWGRIAEQVERKLAKGTPVMLEGRLVHRSYDGKDGVKRYATEIVLSDLKVIDFTMRKEALKTAV